MSGAGQLGRPRCYKASGHPVDSRTRSRSLPVSRKPLIRHHTIRIAGPRKVNARRQSNLNSSCTPAASLFASRRWRLLGCRDVRVSICEPLTDDAEQSAPRPLRVVNTKRDPLRIAEVKFREIPVQMPLAAMLVHAFHAALEDRKVAFNSVGVHDAAHVLAGRVGSRFGASSLPDQAERRERPRPT